MLGGVVLVGVVVAGIVVGMLDSADAVATLTGPGGSSERVEGVCWPKATGLFALPPAVSTAMVPAVEPVGTVAVTCADETSWNWAGTPLKVTPLSDVRLKPVMVTTVPAGPLIGQIDEIEGPMKRGVELTARSVPRTES